MGGELLASGEVVGVCPTVVNHLIDGSPVGQSAYVAVVDIDFGIEFPGTMRACCQRVVGVDGVEFEPLVATPLYGFVEQLAFTVGPEYEYVAFGFETFQCGYGEWAFASYARVVVLYDGSVEIYSYNHIGGSLCLCKDTKKWAFNECAPPGNGGVAEGLENRL